MFEALGEGPYYADPEPEVRFGDVFEAPFLLDVFVRADTDLLGGGAVPAHLVPKLGRWMGETLEEGGLDLYSPRFTSKEADRYALAHASFLPEAGTHRAILLSDSCLASTALAQGRQGRSVGGRLLFAPVGRVETEKWHALVEEVDFERFSLPNDERLPQCGVVELRHCFMVEARVVKEYADARIAKPVLALAEELEARWNAYAARRGPRAYERNTLKLAALLAGGTQPAQEHEGVGDAVAAVLDAAWALEGSDLEDVSEVEEKVRLADGDAAELTPALLERLEARLRELAKLAGEAAGAIQARR